MDNNDAMALADWASRNPAEAAKVWRILQQCPGGGRIVYLPLLPSIMPPDQWQELSGTVHSAQT